MACEARRLRAALIGRRLDHRRRRGRPAAHLVHQAGDRQARAAAHRRGHEVGVARGFRADNPAGDASTAALPKNGTIQKHQRALPYAEVGAALARLRNFDTYGGIRLAFEFLVLTASRSAEVRYAL